MKFVLFSDLHLDSSFSWMAGSPGAAPRRRQALRETLLNIVQTAKEVDADVLLCGGDLYENERFTPDTAAFLKSTFEGLGSMPVYISPGNHDWYGPQSLYRGVDWSPNVHIFNENRLRPVELTDGITLWGAAHLAPASTPGFLDHFKVDRGGVNLALFHGSEKGWFSDEGEGKAPHAPFDADQIESAGIDHAFLGHYHRPRDYDRLTYPGNPDPLSFGEDGQRGVVIATVDSDGSVKRERINVAVTQAHELDVDVTGCSNQQDIRNRVQEALASLKGVARVTLQGEMASEIDFRPSDINSVTSNLESLAIQIGNLHAAYDFELIKNETTVRGEFVRDVYESDLQDDEKRRVLITGLRALDGRDDLEVT